MPIEAMDTSKARFDVSHHDAFDSIGPMRSPHRRGSP